MSNPKPSFTICALFFGDFPQLAERCLSSILRIPSDQYELRIGLNETSVATRNVISALLRDHSHYRYYESLENIHKYPLMRQMLHDPLAPITTPYTMWFDDDSFVKPKTDITLWLDELREKLADAVMVGRRFHIDAQGNQREWVQHQPWYTGKAVPRRFTFLTGGWWVLQSALLRRFNWPIPELDHRGGDVMLGELLRQQGLKVERFSTGVAINADDDGKEGNSPRRGFDSKPIGYYFEPSVAGHVLAAARGAPPALPSRAPPRFIDLEL